MDEISLAFTATKTAIEIAKGMIALSKDVAVQQKASELLMTITDLNDKIHNLQTRITETERIANEWKEKALQRETWDKTKSGYIPYEPTPGVKVYISKKECDSTDRAEWYCKHCVDIEMVPSTLQMVHHSAGGKKYRCHKCKFEFTIRGV
jgi:hypothetical protein